MVADQTCFSVDGQLSQTVWGMVDGSNQLVAVQIAILLAFGSIDPVRMAPLRAIHPFRFMGQEWDAEVGLYNFGARLCSPDLRRFLAPDSTRQTSSPYTFVLQQSDHDRRIRPGTGSRSKRIGTEVGIGLAMAVVTAIGFVLSLFSLGVSDEVAADADAALLANEAAVSRSTGRPLP